MIGGFKNVNLAFIIKSFVNGYTGKPDIVPPSGQPKSDAITYVFCFVFYETGMNNYVKPIEASIPRHLKERGMSLIKFLICYYLYVLYIKCTFYICFNT